MFPSAAVQAIWTPRVLSVLRIMVGLIFFLHGTSKYFSIPNPAPATMGSPLFMAAGAIEVVGGFLLLIGLFSRWAALIMSGEMAVAYFMYFAPASLIPKTVNAELPIILSFIFLYFFFAGPGPWSIDGLRRKA